MGITRDRETIENLRGGQTPRNFNWNVEENLLAPTYRTIHSEPTAEQARHVELVSECRRDGIQGINVYPNDETSIAYINQIYQMGIKRITVGMFPGDNERVQSSTKNILSHMNRETPDAVPILLSLTTPASLDWLRDCKEVNPNLEAIIFMGTAPTRLLVEKWSKQEILHKLSSAINLVANEYKIKVIGATEHTTETPPDFLKDIITTEIESGASSFCIADTIGTARPIGAYRITKFVRQTINDLQTKNISLEWHGHRDLGNDVGNAMASIAAGANRVHVVARGVGERAGNTQMEAVMLNIAQILKESDIEPQWNLRMLNDTLVLYDRMVNLDTPSHGVLSSHAFEARSGLHVAAMRKAQDLCREARSLGYEELADELQKTSRIVYSAIDPETVGREHVVKISPLSGSASVKWVYEQFIGDISGLSQEKITEILRYANEIGRDLTLEEIKKILS